MSQHVSRESILLASGEVDFSYPVASSDCEMAASSRQKVVVVGAGPVGSLAALYAASRGDEVEVYELRGGMFQLLTPSMNPLRRQAKRREDQTNCRERACRWWWEWAPTSSQIYTTPTSRKVPVSRVKSIVPDAGAIFSSNFVPPLSF